MKTMLSIIIPVYNSERYLAETFKSLLSQTLDQSFYEVVVVNDGSEDNSQKIIDEYKAKFRNIKTFEQKNKGVSFSRNRAIKNATSEYILFLDSDDYLANDTLEQIVSFWKKYGSQTDLVTYSLLYDKDGVITEHVRMKQFHDTGVYDLKIYPHLAQTTITVSVRRSTAAKFDESMALFEDEKFNQEVLKKNARIGFCKEANYYYRKYGDSAIHAAHPYYSEDKYLEFYEEILKKYKKNDDIFKYIQGSILYGLSWRIKSDQLLPYHLTEQAQNSYRERIGKIVSQIDLDILLESPYLDFEHVVYLTKLAGLEPELCNRDESIDIYSQDILMKSEEEFKLQIYKSQIANNNLKIDCYFDSCVPDYIEEISLEIESDNYNKKITPFESNLGYHKAKFLTNRKLAFQIDLPISMKKVNMYLNVNGSRYRCMFGLGRRMPFWKVSDKYTLLIGKHEITLDNENKSICVQKASLVRRVRFSIRRDISMLMKNRKAGILRILSWLIPRNIWLYNDRNGVLDNAYYQFLNDKNKLDGIFRFYVYDDDIRPKGISLLQSARYQSLLHKILFVNSSKIISSFRDFEFFSPFDDGFKYYRDKANFEITYLQHGVLHAKTPYIYTQEKNYIHNVVISSNFEKRNFVENYNYREEDLIDSGMPRLDLLNKSDSVEEKKRILLVPSWRRYLIGDFMSGRWTLTTQKFLRSKFYNELNTALTSKKLIGYLKENNIVLELRLHPIFSGYAEHFKLDGQVIKHSEGEVNPADYSLCITDFSSYVFDYVYSDVPVLYFMPDEKEFEAGLVTYRELDLPLSEGFGPITHKSEELIKEIMKMAENEFKLEEKYEKRYKGFFIPKSNHCDSLYRQLKKRNKIK